MLMIGCIATMPLRSEVIDVQVNGFLASNEAVIKAPPDRVYRALLRVGKWWDPAHTYSGDAEQLQLDAQPGGCFCEQIPGKGAIEHMRVVYVSGNSTLRLVGGLGPLQELGVSGSLTWNLEPAESGTKLMLTYNVGGYRQNGFSDLAPLVDQVLLIQLRRLKQFAETGKPVLPGTSATTPAQ